VRSINIDDFTVLELINFAQCVLVQYYKENVNAKEQRVGLKKVNFLHELQNLYYALTNEELTLKTE